MQILKQSTAVDIVLGAFVDDTDGKTAETALTIAQADVQLSKNAGAAAQKNDATSATHLANGHYKIPLNATDTNTVGLLQVMVNESGALPVWGQFQVVEEAIYSKLFAASGSLNDLSAAQVNAECDTAISDAALATAAALATVDTNVDAILVDTGTTLPGTLATIAAYIDTEVAAILADTGELQTDWANGGRLDLLLDAIKAVTDNLPNSGALTDLATAAALATVDTVVDAIKAKTDSLTFTVANKVDSNVTNISGSSTAADNLEASALGIVSSSVNDASATTTAFIISSAEATDDHFNGRIIVFTSGALAGQATDITDYVGATKTVTVTALTEAPANGTTFVIV